MNHGACMEVFGAEKSQASAMEVLEKPPCTVLYPQFCVQALCGFDGSSCGVKYASFAAFAPAVLDTDAGMPCFQTCCRSAGFEARRRCPAGVLGPRGIEAAIMDTGGDAGRALAWYPGLLMAWRFDKADTFFRENQLPAYYGEIDSIRRQLINPRKMMMIGPYLISFPALRVLSKRMPHVNISSQDLNYKDKQNQHATLK
ncbi:hypothetical protein VOLCADRAFT_106392 [Volvox carteri f. nagariensis]|uniref:Uncharacterized protein n=1 Tax=Volvox carteri f. nagariensis TaxID=3068 RepID=D8U743_VOLCA|nr:uncharacterized protein VOLCADRAFT_106392 [Volvox carteri f. nagariensis]EFJ44415.1 hypothetical protein VOLCADRAFT_106392 [Volvox carteri f. nagariensis]|eukprot:XP_002954522.1 hypothetical protein VOLCADRAFT_106392 [Volvox carteri f. nagariensis]